MEVDFDLCLPPDTTALPSSPRQITYLDPEEEIARGPACWLWDYLRRCGETAWTAMPQYDQHAKHERQRFCMPCMVKQT